MKSVSRNLAIKYLATFTFVIFSSQVQAACSRDDVTFYLDKGFSTEQITVLCGPSSTPAASTSASDMQQPDLQDSEQSSGPAAVDDNTLFLQRAIKAREISLSRDALHYTQKICIEFGEEDLFGFTPKVCPDVVYTVSLKGLEVLGTGKKYGFYGTPEVRIKAVIKREIIGNLKDQKPEDQKLIMDELETGDKTAIPIRDDFPLEQVKQVLQELSI